MIEYIFCIQEIYNCVKLETMDANKYEKRLWIVKFYETRENSKHHRISEKVYIWLLWLRKVYQVMVNVPLIKKIWIGYW